MVTTYYPESVADLYFQKLEKDFRSTLSLSFSLSPSLSLLFSLSPSLSLSRSLSLLLSHLLSFSLVLSQIDPVYEQRSLVETFPCNNLHCIIRSIISYIAALLCNKLYSLPAQFYTHTHEDPSYNNWYSNFTWNLVSNAERRWDWENILVGQ